MPVPDFSPGEVLTAAAMDSIGLWKIASATATSGSSLVMNDVFSDLYTNYRITVTHTSDATASQVTFILGAATASYRYGVLYIPTNTGTAIGRTGSGITTASNAYFGLRADSGNKAAGTIDIFEPFVTGQTSWNVASTHAVSNNALGPYVGGGWHAASASHTSITFSLSAGTMTDFTATVYGYRI
jgi:hypothetical protein